jgi:hypothetical protein
MNKKQSIFFGIALLHIVIAIATSSASSNVIIYAFDQNPAGSDEGNEWVTFHNPSNERVDIGNWTFESTHGTTAIDWIAEGTTLYPGAYFTCTPHYGWLDNSEEAIILSDSKGEEAITRTITDIGCVLTQTELLALRNWRRGSYGEDTLRTWWMVIRLTFLSTFTVSEGLD